jgi:hypothetical protein
MRRMHPMRLSYAMFGAHNPFLAWVEDAAERVRKDRRPASPDNPLLELQEQVSRQIVDGLDAWRKSTERLAEESFHAIYASPALQAALGIDTASPCPPRKAARSKLHQALVARRIGELKAEMTRGGLAEAVVRALIYVGLARGAVDERGFAAIREIRATLSPAQQRTLAEFKALVRDQFLLLILDEEAAVRAIPGLLPDSIEERRDAFALLRQVLEAPGALTEEAAARLQEVAALFGLGPQPVTRELPRESAAPVRIGSALRAARVKETS